jgi:hypothetical protein
MQRRRHRTANMQRRFYDGTMARFSANDVSGCLDPIGLEKFIRPGQRHDPIEVRSIERKRCTFRIRRDAADRDLAAGPIGGKARRLSQVRKRQRTDDVADNACWSPDHCADNRRFRSDRKCRLRAFYIRGNAVTVDRKLERKSAHGLGAA